MHKLLSVFIMFLFCSNVNAVGSEQEKYKHYLLIGEIEGSGLTAIINNPADMAENYSKELESIGARLVNYYFVAGSAKMYVIIEMPDSMTAAAHLYQRSSTGLMKVLELIEIIPSDEMVGVLGQAKEFDKIFREKGNAPR